MRNIQKNNCEERRGPGWPGWTTLISIGLAIAILPLHAVAQMSTTTVQGTIYRADGMPASGTLLISWSAFSTPQNQAVAAGTLSTAIGADGFVSVNLTPNVGALPAGTYYTATYHLSDGTVNQEYWVVPASATASVASVRALLQPSTVAVQSVTPAYVNSAVASISSSFLPLAGGTLSGPLTLSADPTIATQAATKHYADQQAAASLPLSGGTVGGALNAQQMEGGLYAEQWQSSKSSNDGIKMSLAECSQYSYACQVIAPATYAQTEAQPWGGSFGWAYGDNVGPAQGQPTGCVLDQRWGPPQWICDGGQAPASINSPTAPRFTSGPTFAVKITSSPQAPSPHTLGVTMMNSFLAGGRNFDVDQTGGSNLQLKAFVYSPTSYNGISNTVYGHSNGDHIGILSSSIGYGGTDAGQDEGNEDSYVHGEAGDVWQSTINSVTTQSATSYPNPCTAPCNVLSTTQTQGGKGSLGATLGLIDLTRADSSGYISLLSSNTATATGADWDTAYGDSNAHSVTTASIDNPAGATVNTFPETNVTVAVANASGFTTAAPACLFDQTNPTWECEPVTAVNTSANTLTFAVMDGSHPSGAIVAQGGLTGYGFTLQADWVGAGNMQGMGQSSVQISNTVRQVWPIMYNTAGNVVNLYTSGEASFNPSNTRAYQQMGSGGTVTATASGGAVTACTASGGSGYSAATDGYGHLSNPPQLSYTLNAGAAAPVLSISGASNGTLSGCSVISGGSGITSISVSVTPTNSYAIYPMTHTVNVWNPATGAVDGSSIATDQLMGTFRTGDTVEQPHYFVTQYRGLLNKIFQYQTGTRGVNGYYFSLGGWFGSNHYGGILANTNSPTLYQSFPAGSEPWVIGQGRMSTPYGHTLGGPWRNGLWMQMPAFGGNGNSYMGAVVVGCTPYCSQWNAWSQVLTHQNANNGQTAEDVLEYNPSTFTWQWTAGAARQAGSNPYCSVNLAGSSNGGLSINCNGNTSKFDTAGDLSLPGSLHAQGAVSGGTINGEITVDGVTYTSLNAAWNAAVSQATTSGRNQTVRLGPGTFSVNTTMNEPANGACVSVMGSGGATMNADSSQIATTLTVPASLGGDVFFLGNTAQAQGCTFRDLNLLAGGNATHGFELQWFRGALIDNVTVNDTTAEGILLGEENTAAGHQANFRLRNTTVSYSSAAFTPANRPAYGIHLLKTAMDSNLDTIVVRNALTAAVYNEGTGNTGYAIHGFGYPYTCTTAPCANNASAASAANASYATSYVIYDTGGSGSVWTDTYADSPAVAGFYVGANGVAIHGGHIQWPDLTSFPAANLAYVASAVTNNLLIADVDCLEMANGVNWITYAGTAGNPPTYASVHHLTGCGNYYQALEPANVTGFSSGGANVNDPSGAVPRVWSTPVAAASSYPAYSAQMYTGYQGDAFQAHFSGVNPFFNITYQGTIRSNGGLALSTIINTASTLTLTAANKNVIANAASGAQTITLPSCYTALPDNASPTGLEFTISKSDSSSNAVTLQPTSSQLIYYQGTGAATLVLSSPSTQTLVCGPDYNWYVTASAASSMNNVSSFNGRTGAVTPAANDYSFSQLSGQASNAQLPSTLTAPTTGNASTATALAATPSQCPAGYYAQGVTANGTANCLQSWHFTWYGNFAGTFGTSTNSSLGAIWSPTASISMTRLDIAVGTAPAGCTTWPVIGIYDTTSSSWLKTVTLASGTYSYRNGVSAVAIIAGHNLSMGVQTAGAGCTTNPAVAQLTMEYTMNQ